MTSPTEQLPAAEALVLGAFPNGQAYGQYGPEAYGGAVLGPLIALTDAPPHENSTFPKQPTATESDQTGKVETETTEQQPPIPSSQTLGQIATELTVLIIGGTLVAPDSQNQQHSGQDDYALAA